MTCPPGPRPVPHPGSPRPAPGPESRAFRAADDTNNGIKLRLWPMTSSPRFYCRICTLLFSSQVWPATVCA